MLADELLIFAVLRQLLAERLQRTAIPTQRAKAGMSAQAGPKPPIVFHCPSGAELLTKHLH